MSELSDYMPLKEAAEKLGYAATTTLLKWAQSGQIPGAMRFGRAWALPVAWIEAHAAVGPQSPKGGLRGKGVRINKKSQ